MNTRTSGEPVAIDPTQPAVAAAGPRLTADERRLAIIVAAMTEFARGGYAGTSTDAIARRAGVSQPYLFQLFGTKKDLFIAVVRDCFQRTQMHFDAAGRTARSQTADPLEILHLMGASYADLIADRDLLLMQLHAYAACSDPDIRDVVREEFAALYRDVARVAGVGDAELEQWFAYGMLCNVATAVGLRGSDGIFKLSSLLDPDATFELSPLNAARTGGARGPM